MDAQLSAQIAAEIAKHLPSFSWTTIVIQAVILLLVAIGAAFFGEYFRGRGKTWATKADFEQLQTQLEGNTRLVETVRAQVNQQDWTRREWISLRRLKLAELLTLANAAERFVEMRENAAVRSEVSDAADPRDEMKTIVVLYLPELEEPLNSFSACASRRLIAAGNLMQQRFEAGSDENEKQALFDAFLAARDLQPLVNAHDELRAAARGLLLETFGAV